MTPRPKVDADPVATATMERIRRSFDERPQRKGLQWGAVVVALFVGYLGAKLAGSSDKHSEPVAAARHEVVATATPDSTESGVASDAAYQRSLVGLPRRVANPDAIANNGEHFAPRAAFVDPDEAAPRPVGSYFNVIMPDGQRIHSIVGAAVPSVRSLPPSGQLGDAHYVAADGHWYIWAQPVGGGVATWIDP